MPFNIGSLNLASGHINGSALNKVYVGNDLKWSSFTGEEMLLSGNDSGQLYRIDMSDGSDIWRVTVQSGTQVQGVFVDRTMNVIYAVLSNGTIKSYDVSGNLLQSWSMAFTWIMHIGFDIENQIVYAYTSSNGYKLVKYDMTTNVTTNIDFGTSNYITSVDCDSDGYVYVGTADFLIRRYNSSLVLQSSYNVAGRINRTLQRSTGELIIAAGSRVYRFTSTLSYISYFTTSEVSNNIGFTPTQNLLTISYYYYTYFVLDPLQIQWQKNQTRNTGTGIVTDSDGNIYYGDYYGYLAKKTPAGLNVYELYKGTRSKTRSITYNSG